MPSKYPVAGKSALRRRGKRYGRKRVGFGLLTGIRQDVRAASKTGLKKYPKHKSARLMHGSARKIQKAYRRGNVGYKPLRHYYMSGAYKSFKYN